MTIVDNNMSSNANQHSSSGIPPTMELDDDYQNVMLETKNHRCRKRIDPWSTSSIQHYKRRRLDPSEFYSSSSDESSASDTSTATDDTISQEENFHHHATRQLCVFKSSSPNDTGAIVPWRKRPACDELEFLEEDHIGSSASSWPAANNTEQQHYYGTWPITYRHHHPRPKSRNGCPPLEMKYQLPPQLLSPNMAAPVLSNCRAMVVWTPPPPATEPKELTEPTTATSSSLMLQPAALPVPMVMSGCVPHQMVSVNDDDEHDHDNRTTLEDVTFWDKTESDDLIMDTSDD